MKSVKKYKNINREKGKFFWKENNLKIFIDKRLTEYINQVGQLGKLFKPR